MTFLTGIAIGIIIASVIWFFVWRNNKQLIKEQIEKIDKMVNKTGI